MALRISRRLPLLAGGLLVGVLLALVTPGWASPTSGGPLTVNSLLDSDDAVAGNGVCETANGNQVCTLRGAIEEANFQPGADTILFAVTGTITLSNSLPNIDQSLTILGPGPDALRVDASYLPTIHSGHAIGMIGNPSYNLYIISGLELRGLIATLGVNNGSLLLDNFRLAHGHNLIVFGAGTHVTVQNSVFIENSSYTQGIVWVEEAQVLITDSLFQSNVGPYGALLNDSTTIVRNTTFVSNTAYYDGVDDSGGGAIFNNPGGRLTVINSTISGNNATDVAARGGGGIFSMGVLTLTNVTLNNNTAPPGLGGGLRLITGSVTLLQNTLIANSPQGGDCSNQGGTLIDGGYNLVGDNSCGFSGGADPLLGALADNGGPTPTHALLAGSPAIDAGNPAGCADPLGGWLFTDQRGYLRAVDGNADTTVRCDIGAFEYLSAAPNLPYRLFLPWL